MSANTVEVRVGRLMEIVVTEGFRSVEDVEAQRRRIDVAFTAAPADRPVIVAADWRACQVMSQPAAAALGAMLATYNARIERSAVLGSHDAPIAVLQFLRVVRETRHPARKVFEERPAMLKWLGECLT